MTIRPALDLSEKQIDAIQADLARFKALGIAEVVAISADPATAQAQRAARTGITLPTLAGPVSRYRRRTVRSPTG